MAEEKQEPIVGSPEIHFEPLVKLKAVEIKHLEDNEDELLNLHAKLYRFIIDEEEGPQWKERGEGKVQILKQKDSSKTRLLMRREKTLKVCANHMLISGIELKPHGKSGRAFVWVTEADCSEEEVKRETLAIRLDNKDAAETFKEAFENAVELSGSTQELSPTKDALEDKLSALKVTDNSDSKEEDNKSKANATSQPIAVPANSEEQK